MKVIFVLQIKKIVWLTGQLLFWTRYRFFFNFVNSIILRYYLGLLAAIIPDDPGLKRFILLRLTWVQLVIQETFIFKDSLQPIMMKTSIWPLSLITVIKFARKARPKKLCKKKCKGKQHAGVQNSKCWTSVHYQCVNFVSIVSKWCMW